MAGTSPAMTTADSGLLLNSWNDSLAIEQPNPETSMPTRVDAGAETVHWGYFDAALAPVATIDSGDVVTLGTVSGTAEQMPQPPFRVPPALPAIHNAKTKRIVPGHMLTGPVAVHGARAGQV